MSFVPPLSAANLYGYSSGSTGVSSHRGGHFSWRNFLFQNIVAPALQYLAFSFVGELQPFGSLFFENRQMKLLKKQQELQFALLKDTAGEIWKNVGNNSELIGTELGGFLQQVVQAAQPGLLTALTGLQSTQLNATLHAQQNNPEITAALDLEDAKRKLKAEEATQSFKVETWKVQEATNLKSVQEAKPYTDRIDILNGDSYAKGVNHAIDQVTWHGVPALVLLTAAPLIVYLIYRQVLHNIGRPKLAIETRQHSILTPFLEPTDPSASRENKPVFNPDLTRRIDTLIGTTQNIRENGGCFQNVLFYGPGGTGKTMISEYIAKNSGMSYIKMSGGDLAQYIKRGEHVTELNKLLDKMTLSWRPWSTRPWILFIDEAESLCRDRSKIPTAELLELQNALLNRTGTESNKFMMILSTNRMEDLDSAILDRLDHKIFIGPPAEPERARILKLYTPKLFSPAEQAEFFTDPKIQKIARSTEGLTGRALFKLLNGLANKKAMAAGGGKLTQPMIDQTIKDVMLQEKEVEKRRSLRGC